MLAVHASIRHLRQFLSITIRHRSTQSKGKEKKKTQTNKQTNKQSNPTNKKEDFFYFIFYNFGVMTFHSSPKEGSSLPSVQKKKKEKKRRRRRRRRGKKEAFCNRSGIFRLELRTIKSEWVVLQLRTIHSAAKDGFLVLSSGQLNPFCSRRGILLLS